MEFKKGSIAGVKAIQLKKYIDERGWLVETFRHDELEKPYFPVMSYSSVTHPGVVRGPHEHVDQADLFVFIGPGNFKIYLWDNRKDSPTYWTKTILYGGQDNPMQLLVPPGVVHAYKNVSYEVAQVHNYPNQLFMGPKKESPIDEIRHEDQADTPFQVD